MISILGVAATVMMTQGSISDKIAREAKKAGIDPRLAIAVAKVESGLKQSARGKAGEIGVFQLHPKFFNSKQASRLENNISLGVAHLAFWKAHCPVKEDQTWVTCYNQGKRAPKFPRQLPYYKKVMRAKAGLQ